MAKLACQACAPQALPCDLVYHPAQPPETMAAALAAMVGQPRASLDPLVQAFFGFYDTTYGRQVGDPLYVQVRLHTCIGSLGSGDLGTCMYLKRMHEQCNVLGWCVGGV